MVCISIVDGFINRHNWDHFVGYCRERTSVWRNGFKHLGFASKKHGFARTKQIQTASAYQTCQILDSHIPHVCNIHQHLPQTSSIHEGKYTTHGASGIYHRIFACIVFLQFGVISGSCCWSGQYTTKTSTKFFCVLPPGKPLKLSVQKKSIHTMWGPQDSVQLVYNYNFTFGFMLVITIVRWGALNQQK